jgi:hypothetical protein
MIIIWRYENAPQDLKDLRPFSTSGTWVLRAPTSLSTEVEAFLKLNLTSEVVRHEMVEGTVVFFG